MGMRDMFEQGMSGERRKPRIKRVSVVVWARWRLLGAVTTLLFGFAAGAEAQEGQLPVEVNEFGGAFDSPLSVTAAPGYPNLVFVVEKGGTVQVVKGGERLERPFLDITDRVSEAADEPSEQGLFSIAFPPDYARSGLFYAYFTNRKCNPETGGCDIEVAEFKRRGDDATRARPGTRRKVLTIRHRGAGNHNGGTAAFGPDGKLWLATGDGGGGGDPFDNARDKTKLLGKLLRINPREPTGKSKLGYRVPRGNPFVGVEGDDEIWSIGLRNPFRFSFDGETIAIGDVGQSRREEVNIFDLETTEGADFGWPAREGDVPFDPARPGSGPLLEPIHVYPRPPAANGGVSVTGGLFVRDPRLAGTAFDPAGSRYLFGEAFVQPTIRSFVPDIASQTISGYQNFGFGLEQVVGFGEDLDRRVYIASLSGTVYRLDPVATP